VDLDRAAHIPRYTDPRWNGYLANMPPSIFRAHEEKLPDKLLGSDYLPLAHVHVDPFTKLRPEVTYRVRACTRYAVEENHRVRLFAELARGMSAGYNESGAVLMGELMYQSHWAYTDTGLGCEKTDLLIDLSREQGPERGIFGAKVTGGGAGGTVAILGSADAEGAFEKIVSNYKSKTGIDPYLFRGSSPGADRFGIVILEP
jgi:galactokinase